MSFKPRQEVELLSLLCFHAVFALNTQRSKLVQTNLEYTAFEAVSNIK